MNQNFQIIFSLLAVLSFSQDWFLVEKSFFGDFPLSEIDEWDFNINPVGLKQTCGADTILGGFNTFGQMTELSREFNFIPETTRVRVTANVYYIDDWAFSDLFILDLANLSLVSSTVFPKLPIPFTPLCGNNVLDLKNTAQTEFATTQPFLKVLFSENLTNPKNVQSWGINNISVEYLGTCDGEYTIDADGFKICDLSQQCFDNLGTLMDGEGNLPVTNICQINPILPNETIFQFLIQILPPYIYDRDCLFFRVFFGGKELSQTLNLFPVDFYVFLQDTQTLEFNIQFSDFDGEKYDCTFIEEPDKFTWICDFSVDFISLGLVQVTYSAKIMVCVDRIQDGELLINVQKNEVVGECCENELNIQTELRFCSSSDCSEYLPDPIVITRKESFFVEQRIITPGFQSYFLELVQVELGQFFPNIINIDNSQPGRLIIELRSNIAKPNLVLSVISRLHKDQPTLRQLQEGEGFYEQSIRKDYRLISYEEISIVLEGEEKKTGNKELFDDDSKFIKQKQVEQELIVSNLDNGQNQSYMILILSCSIIGFFLILFIVAVVIKGKKTKQKQQLYKDVEFKQEKV